jgi:thioredoxin 1
MKGATTNIVIILAVVAVVVVAAWLKTQRSQESSHQDEPPAFVDSSDQSMASQVNTTAPSSPTASEAPETPAPRSATPSTSPVESKRARLLDLGADKCKACKALAPILEALREEYKGRLDVEFIDVWKNPSAGEPYGIRLIPTQILYDREGKEVWRHEGFISKEDLKALFADKVGVE